VVSLTPRPLYTRGKNRQHPLHRRLGGPQGRSWSSYVEKNSQPLSPIETQLSSPWPSHYTDRATAASIYKGHIQMLRNKRVRDIKKGHQSNYYSLLTERLATLTMPLPCQSSVRPTTESPCRATFRNGEDTSTRWSRCRSWQAIAWIEIRIAVTAVVPRHFCPLWWHSNESGHGAARHSSHHH
jgi:hypothetical protein